MTVWGQKIEKVLLFLFLLLIPTQLGKHWWPEWSYVNGIKIDYLSPTLYLLDLVWGMLVIFNFQFSIFKNTKKVGFMSIMTLLGVGVNILVAGNRWVAIYRWLRMGQWLVTIRLVAERKETVKRILGVVVPIWIVIEGLLGWAQIVNNGSLGGWWYWLGERNFRFTTIGIAQMAVLGTGLVRAYGTFSHPNSLAGFLLVGLFWWMRRKESPRNIGFWIVVWAGVAGILASGSRIAWGILILIFNFQFFRQRRTSLPDAPIGTGRFAIFNLERIKSRLFWGRLLLSIGVGLFFWGLIGREYMVSDFLGGWDSEGLDKRMSLNLKAVKMWTANPLFGVGAGNYLVKLPDYNLQNGKGFWIQPVHNIYLLLGSELGIIGVIILLRWVGQKRWLRLWKKKRWWWVVAATGFFDHYWVTLPQNSWLLAVLLGLI